MKKRIQLLLMLAVLMCAGVSVLAASVVTYNGNALAPFKRTKAQVMQAYRDAAYRSNGYKDGDRSSWYEVPASTKAPYDKGVLASHTLESMGIMMNYLRYLYGVEPASYNTENQAYLQAQALDRNFNFNHWIQQEDKPEDMPQEIWDEGFECNHNILAGGYTPRGAMVGWLDEGYSLWKNSWDTLGHRYAVIGASVKTLYLGSSGWVTIGDVVEGGTTLYDFSKVQDDNGDGTLSEEDESYPWNCPEQEGHRAFKDAFAAWPCPGPMPNWLIGARTSAWSIELNGNNLRVIDSSKVAVKVTNVNTGASYECTQANGKADAGFDFIHFVQPEPDSDDAYLNTYRVEVTGIKDVATKQDAKIIYTVEFFSNPDVTVIYEGAYAGVENVPEQQIIIDGVSQRLSSQIPSYHGYDFKGWSKTWWNPGRGEAEYLPGGLFRESGQQYVYLYPVWKPWQYTLRFDSNGGKAVRHSLIKEYGESVYLPQTWFFNGEEWDTFTRDGYELIGWAKEKTNPTRIYALNEVYNEEGDATFYAVWKKVLRITQQPKDIIIGMNDTGALSLQASGEDISFKWEFSKNKGKTWASWGSAQHMPIQALNGRDGYWFRCTVKDSYGDSLTSNIITLTIISSGTVYTEPKILSQPQAISGAVGEEAKISLIATGSGLKYRWEFSKDGGKTWAKWSSARDASVTISSDKNNRQYRCVITDSKGVQLTSKAVKITVLSQITKQPEAASGTVGSQVSFTATAVGAPKLTYRWYMSKDGGKSWNYYKLGQKLDITVSSDKNNYQFRCEITDGNGKKLTTKAAKLTVLPMITKQPSVARGAVGSQVSFTATAVGAPKLTYRWYMSKDGGNSWNYYKLGQNLDITVSSDKNNYQFRCEITDGNGKKLTTRAVKLSVLPVITRQPSAQTAAAGTDVSFTATAVGAANLSYRWYFSSDNGASWYLYKTAQTISFKATYAKNGYLYRCEIKDGNGRILTTNEVSLTVK